MPRFSANISTLFLEHPPLERMRAARRAGFRVQPRIRLVLINVPAGDLNAGGPGLAAMPGREAAFRDAVADCAR